MSGLRRTYPGLPALASPPSEGLADTIHYPEAVAPAVGYITSRTPMRSVLAVPGETLRVGSAVVNRVPNRQGESHLYSRGADTMPAFLPTQVRSSLFQTSQLGPIVNVARNAHLYRCGFPISGALLRANPGLSVKVGAIATPKNGGTGQGQSAMAAKPAFKRVQSVPRYITQPGVYATRSASA